VPEIAPIDYTAVNGPVLAQVPLASRRLLDLGCGTGAFGKQVKKQHPCEIVGVTYSESEAVAAREELDDVLVRDLNDFDPSGLGQFDCVVCSHVLEHLYRPQDVLRKVHGILDPSGVLIIALPNVLFWKQRMRFLRGRFEYTQGGLMDSTHFRFFDWNTASLLVEESGYRINRRAADGFFPLPILRRVAKPLAVRIDHAAATLLPGFFGYQFVITASPS
jgi:SAM-dependent methyltransferase